MFSFLDKYSHVQKQICACQSDVGNIIRNIENVCALVSEWILLICRHILYYVIKTWW